MPTTPLDPYVVRVVFADGEVRDVDIEPLLSGPAIADLRDPGLFAQVEVDEFAATTVWPRADLDPRRLRNRPTGHPAGTVRYRV